MNRPSVRHRNEKGISLRDFIRVISRRKWWFVAPIVISVVSGIILLKYLPKTYRSSTLILVEAQKVPEDYVKSAVTGTIEDRLATIRQQILSRSLLQKVIEEFGLYPSELNGSSKEELLESMRKNIEIKTDGTRKTVDSFTISFEGKDPRTVMEVTSKLASLYIEENLKVREQLVEGTTEFLETELRTLKESLDKQEQQISEHKRKYMGSLPQQLDANLRSLDRYQMELQSISTSLIVAEDKRNALEEKMKVTRMPGIKGEMGTTLMSDASDNDVYANLAQMKLKLEVLRGEYTEAYPDIAILKRKIQELENNHSRSPIRNRKPGKDKPIEKSQETVSYAIDHDADLQRQLREILSEIRALREREKNIAEKIRELEKAVQQTPMREQEMDGLLRDYENTRKGYQALLDKKLNAELSENLEKRQKGEQFRILDPANLPEKPFKPDKVRLIALCLMVGLGTATGLVILVDKSDTSFKRPKEIEIRLGFPVLAVVPRFEQKKNKLAEFANK